MSIMAFLLNPALWLPRGLLPRLAAAIHPIQITLLGGKPLFFFQINHIDSLLRLFRCGPGCDHAFVNAFGSGSYPPTARRLHRARAVWVMGMVCFLNLVFSFLALVAARHVYCGGIIPK